MIIKRHCEQCGASFSACRSYHRFCSTICRVRSHRTKLKEKPEVVEAKVSLYQFYKQQLEQLSEKQLLEAIKVMSLESAEQRKARRNQESLLTKVLREVQ